AAATATQSVTARGATLNTLPPKVTISTCPTTVTEAITRNCGFSNSRCSPDSCGESDRQLIWFHTWKNTYTVKNSVTCRSVSSGNSPDRGPSPANHPACSMPTSSPIITTTK